MAQYRQYVDIINIKPSTIDLSICLVLFVLILDGNSEIGAQVRSNRFYSICLRDLIRSRAVTDQILFFERNFFSSCVHVLSVIFSLKCNEFIKKNIVY